MGCYGISSEAPISILLTSHQGGYSKFLVGGRGLGINKNKQYDFIIFLTGIPYTFVALVAGVSGGRMGAEEMKLSPFLTEQLGE